MQRRVPGLPNDDGGIRKMARAIFTNHFTLEWIIIPAPTLYYCSSHVVGSVITLVESSVIPHKTDPW